MILPTWLKSKNFDASNFVSISPRLKSKKQVGVTLGLFIHNISVDTTIA